VPETSRTIAELVLHGFGEPGMILRMAVKLIYQMSTKLLSWMVLHARSETANEIEILVLRHQIDDAIADFTLVDDVEHNVPNYPFPSGTRVSLRVIHYCELDNEGRITRENGYELWRRADAPRDDDIPTDAVTVHFD